jgi:predicted permease
MAELDITLLIVLFFCIAYIVVNGIISDGVARLKGFDSGMSSAFKNSIIFNNTGNIGLSLITLIFSGGSYLINGETPYLNEAIAVIVIVMVFSNITSNTLGFYNAGRATMSISRSIRKIFSLPSIYVIPLALILKRLNVDITGTFVWPSLIYMRNAMVAMALLTLGVQLSKTKTKINDKKVFLAVFMRLVGGPILAIVLIKIFGFKGVVAQTLFIVHSVPTAVNTALIAVECKNCEEFATQAVILSTVLSAITLTFSIYISQTLFPI